MATETHYSDLKEARSRYRRVAFAQRCGAGSQPVRCADHSGRTVADGPGVDSGFAIVALIVSFLLPRHYTATVLLLPPQQNSSLGTAIASQLGNLGPMAALAGSSLGIKNINDLYVSMMKSQRVEDSMIRDFELQKEYRAKLMSDARKAFEKHAKVDGSGKDGLIRISVEDRDPARAAQLANSYVQHFQALSETLAITEASQRRLFFEKQLEQAKDNLANAEEAMKMTQQTTGLIQLDSQARALSSQRRPARADCGEGDADQRWRPSPPARTRNWAGAAGAAEPARPAGQTGRIRGQRQLADRAEREGA